MDRNQTSVAVVGLAYLLGSLCLIGCAGASVDFDEEQFPKPLVEVIDLDIGVVLDDELTSYVHIEEIEMYGDWEVKLGLVQRLLFGNTLGAMFLSVTEVESATEAHPDLDAVLVPQIVGFQISIPSQTRTNFYEVWIKYQLSLYDSHGELIAEWPLTAYGKSNREDYGLLEDKDEPALEDATMLALRDAAAFLSLRFSHVPAIEAWLAARESGVPVAPVTSEVPSTSAAPAAAGQGAES